MGDVLPSSVCKVRQIEIRSLSFEARRKEGRKEGRMGFYVAFNSFGQIESEPGRNSLLLNNPYAAGVLVGQYKIMQKS